MVKSKIAISFDTTFLNSLRDIEKSGVEIQRAKHHVALHPIHSNDYNKSIKELLNEKVARYSKDLNGILLGYQNIKLLSGEGTLHDDSCYIHCDIEADFYVFKPEVGEEMQGVVARKSKDHVGLLVYNTFNVSIPAPQDQDNWLGKHVAVGYEVSFRIVHFSFTSYLPYIKGELISILTDVDSGMSSETTSGNSEKCKKGANKKILFDDDPPMQELSDEEHHGAPDLKKKKSKKAKSRSSSNDFSIIENEEDHEVPSEFDDSIKKKKLKKEKIRSSDHHLSPSGNIDYESVDRNESLNINNKKEKKVKKVKLENLDWVDDFENFLNESENQNTKKRKSSVNEISESPKKKKKRHS